MNRNLTVVIVISAFLIAGLLVFDFFIDNKAQVDTAADHDEKLVDTATNHKNAVYIVDGQRVKLHDGVSETEAAPGSAARVTTRHFGNEVRTDLNNDGREDVVFILTQDTGGSATFYYVVAALDTVDGYVGSHAFLLGDRIAPQTTDLSQNPAHENVLVVNYAERAEGAPMTAQPMVGTSVWLKLNPDTLQFGVVEQDFEGEADPSIMSLAMKDWTWISARYNDGRSITPNQPDVFALSFSEDGHFFK